MMGLTINRAIRLTAAASVFAAAATLFTNDAIAQTGGPGVPVDLKNRPEFDPIGVRAGSFVFLPSIDLDAIFTDNLFATQSGNRMDLITEVSPKLEIESDWNRHSLIAAVEASFGHHYVNNNEDYDDFTASTAFRADVIRDAYLQFGAGFDKLHEDRSSPDNSVTNNPTEFRRSTLEGEGSYVWNRLSAVSTAVFEHYDYDDTLGSNGRLTNNDDRDRSEIFGDLRLTYEIVPEYKAFVRGGYNNISYQANVDDGGFRRDSHGFLGEVGVRLDLGGLISGDVALGVKHQEYEEGRFDTLDEPYGSLNLQWLYSQLTTFRAFASHNIIETTLTNASSGISQALRVTADHELRRNLLLHGALEGGLTKYQGNGRNDQTYGATLRARYLMNRHLYVTLEYDGEKRISNGNNAGFLTNMVTLRLESQF